MSDYIYVVEVIGVAPFNQRLVKAANASRATRHVAREMFSVHLATQDELVNLTTDGVKVEHATELI